MNLNFLHAWTQVTQYCRFKSPSLPPALTDLVIPILVPFSTYSKDIVQSDSLKISAVVTDKQKPDNKYLAVNDVVLANPPISITVSKKKTYLLAPCSS